MPVTFFGLDVAHGVHLHFVGSWGSDEGDVLSELVVPRVVVVTTWLGNGCELVSVQVRYDIVVVDMDIFGLASNEFQVQGRSSMDGVRSVAGLLGIEGPDAGWVLALVPRNDTLASFRNLSGRHHHTFHDFNPVLWSKNVKLDRLGFLVDGHNPTRAHNKMSKFHIKY